MYLCTLKLIGMTGQKTPTALGTEKIGKLLMQYAIPAIIAMTASSLYNMVDSIFIGHGVGAMAISGLALTFLLMNLAAAFGSLVGDDITQQDNNHIIAGKPTVASLPPKK